MNHQTLCPPVSLLTLQVQEQSVSVQRSPIKTNADTQADIVTSDAVVQWPVDVCYLVTMDYIYAGKHEIELKKQEAEDSELPDLFLSDEKLSEESEPQYRQSDLEYNVGCSYRWQSQPTLSGTKGAENLIMAALVFFSGHFAVVT